MEAAAALAGVPAPGGARCLEQRLSAEHVGAQELRRVLERAVDVRLGGEVHDRPERLFTEQRGDALALADVTAHETDPAGVDEPGDAREIAGVGEGIEHHHAVAGMRRAPVVAEVRADEPGPAGDEQPPHGGAPPPPTPASVARSATRQWGAVTPRSFSVARLSRTL